MTDAEQQVFRRKIIGERILLMLPLNVVLAAQIRGTVDPESVITALDRLRSRHPLLAVRAEIRDDGTGMYVGSNVPPIQFEVVLRKSDDQWLARVEEELQAPFPIETGPLVRCSLVHSERVCDVILCGLHTICDGMSLGYLLRDLLECLAEPEKEIAGPVIPPAIDSSTVPKPPSTHALQRFIMGLINRKWEAKGIQFNESDMCRMHVKYWESNTGIQLLAWTLDAEDTARLVEQSRAEKVTVNSTLWTAFLAAQYEVQPDRLRYRQRSALAVSTRDKLNVPVGDALGFYASSLTAKLPYCPTMSFWDNARVVQEKITKELAKTDLFRMLSSELIHPTLLDSLYFRKFGLMEGAMPNKLLRKMKWHQTTYGYALTNVGRFDIPTSYGPLELEAVHGPLFYSDVEEKMLGVITVGGRLSFFHVSRRPVVGDATLLKDAAMRYLKAAVGEST